MTTRDRMTWSLRIRIAPVHGARHAADSAAHGQHGASHAAGHGEHAGHDPDAFRRQFWIVLVLPMLRREPGAVFGTAAGLSRCSRIGRSSTSASLRRSGRRAAR
jgi:hypothetical protein